MVDRRVAERRQQDRRRADMIADRAIASVQTHYPLRTYWGPGYCYLMACDYIGPEDRIAVGSPTCDKCRAYMENEP